MVVHEAVTHEAAALITLESAGRETVVLYSGCEARTIRLRQQPRQNLCLSERNECADDNQRR